VAAITPPRTPMTTPATTPAAAIRTTDPRRRTVHPRRVTTAMVARL
jgi:hypothetical protein